MTRYTLFIIINDTDQLSITSIDKKFVLGFYNKYKNAQYMALVKENVDNNSRMETKFNTSKEILNELKDKLILVKQ